MEHFAMRLVRLPSWHDTNCIVARCSLQISNGRPKMQTAMQHICTHVESIWYFNRLWKHIWYFTNGNTRRRRLRRRQSRVVVIEPTLKWYYLKCTWFLCIIVNRFALYFVCRLQNAIARGLFRHTTSTHCIQILTQAHTRTRWCLVIIMNQK